MKALTIGAPVIGARVSTRTSEKNCEKSCNSENSMYLCGATRTDRLSIPPGSVNARHNQRAFFMSVTYLALYTAAIPKIFVLGNEIASVFVATESAAVLFVCLATNTDAQMKALTIGAPVIGARVSTRNSEKNCEKSCNSEKSVYLCGALHYVQATESPTAFAAGLFYSRGQSHINTSSVPCGALMRPLPVSRCSATGSGTFFVAAPQRYFINCFI